VSLYVRTGRNHAIGLPWWFVPFYALGFLLVLSLVLAAALVALIAVGLWHGGWWLVGRARSEPEPQPEIWTPTPRTRDPRGY
jgi:hypothetical protein